MFPDPSLRWIPFPSILDGIIRPPFVLDRGLWNGTLALIVLEGGPSKRAYGVQVKCEVYLAIEEMLYSVADHAGSTSYYDGGVYIKESSTIPASEAFRGHYRGLGQGRVRRFLFVGSDYCYETVGFQEPAVQAFVDVEAAYAWNPDTAEHR